MLGDDNFKALRNSTMPLAIVTNVGPCLGTLGIRTNEASSAEIDQPLKNVLNKLGEFFLLSWSRWDGKR